MESQYSIAEAKAYLAARGVPVRLVIPGGPMTPPAAGPPLDGPLGAPGVP